MRKLYFGLTMSPDGLIAEPNVSATDSLGGVGEQLYDWMFAGMTGDEAQRLQEETFSATGGGAPPHATYIRREVKK